VEGGVGGGGEPGREDIEGGVECSAIEGVSSGGGCVRENGRDEGLDDELQECQRVGCELSALCL